MTVITESAGVLERTKAPGRVLLTIITAGKGSSGTYPAETLREAVANQVFPAGLKLYGDHPTEDESAARPEGSIWNAVGTLAEDARWDESRQAVIAEANIYPSVKDVIYERAHDIGASIRGQGELDGDGNVTRLGPIRSVDLVTEAGRGGGITELIESARRDIIERNGGTYEPRHANTRPEPDTPIETPGLLAESGTTETAGGNMVEITEAQHAELTESAGRVPALENELAEAVTRAEEAEAKLAEAATEQTRAKAEAVVAEAFTGIDAPRAKARLVEAAVAGDEFDAEAFKAEVEEAAAEFTPAGVQVSGFGDTDPVSESEMTDEDYRAAAVAILEGR